MRDLLRPTAVAAALLTPFLIVGVLKAGDPVPEPVPEPAEGVGVPGFTHDGAVPIALITSFEDARRSILNTKPEVAAATACTFLTDDAQADVVADAAEMDLVGEKAECGDAMQALVEKRNVPGKVTSVSVTRAEDEVSEIVVVRSDGTAETYMLVGDRSEDAWLIDDIAVGDAPEVVAEPAAEAPTKEDLIADREDEQRSGIPAYDGATGEDAPAAPSVTVLPGEE